MNLKAISSLSILVLLLGVSSSSYHLAFALENTNDQSILKKDLQSIMNDYKAAVTKAKADLLSSIAKAKAELKLDIQKAKVEAKAALIQLKAAVDKNNLS